MRVNAATGWAYNNPIVLCLHVTLYTADLGMVVATVFQKF